MLLLAAMLRLAALRWLGVCVILLTPLSAANLASAHELVQTKTRVGGFESAAPLHIWLNGSATERSYSGNLRCEPEVASESLLAARGAPQLSKEAAKSVRSLQQRPGEHQNKLDAFRKNPDAFDNKGFLKNAPSQEVRERIINGRVNHLEQEIRNFQQQIDRLRGGGGE